MINVVVEPDRRSRMLIMLQRADRPIYTVWHCPYCTNQLCEILNANVTAMSDLVATEDINNVGVGFKCNGRSFISPTGKCNTYFYFKLG